MRLCFLHDSMDAVIDVLCTLVLHKWSDGHITKLGSLIRELVANVLHVLDRVELGLTDSVGVVRTIIVNVAFVTLGQLRKVWTERHR